MASSPTYLQPGALSPCSAPCIRCRLPGCHPVTSSFLSPPGEQRSLCVQAHCEPALPRDREQQAAPTLGCNPHPAQPPRPRVGDNVSGLEGGGTGDTKGPQGAWERARSWFEREEGWEEPGPPLPPHPRGQVLRVLGDSRIPGGREVAGGTRYKSGRS